MSQVRALRKPALKMLEVYVNGSDIVERLAWATPRLSKAVLQYFES